MTTDTPRTDADEPQLDSNKGGWVRADFARQLERELNEAKAKIENLKTEYWFMEEALSKEIEALKEELNHKIIKAK